MSQYYEKNLNKYFYQLDTQFSKIVIYKRSQINDLIESLEEIFSLARKAAKDYIIFLSFMFLKDTLGKQDFLQDIVLYIHYETYDHNED